MKRKKQATVLTLAALGILPAVVPGSANATEPAAPQLEVKVDLNLPPGAIYAGQFAPGTRPTGANPNQATAAALAATADGATPCGGFIWRHWEPGVEGIVASVRYYSTKAITDWKIGLCAVTEYRSPIINDVTNAGKALGYSYSREELGPESWYMKWGPAGPQGAHHFKWSSVFDSPAPFVGDKHLGADVDVYGDGAGCFQMNGSDQRDCWWF